MLQATCRGIRGLSEDASGNVAILLAIALIPIMLGVGAAVDYGRALMVRNQMADAADAAALAVASWPELSEAEMNTKAQQFFAANFPPSALGEVRSLKVNFIDDDIEVQVSASVPTTIMKLAHIDKIDLGVTNRITKQGRGLRIAK
jgi:Flp pilus assembly protein TadG